MLKNTVLIFTKRLLMILMIISVVIVIFNSYLNLNGYLSIPLCIFIFFSLFMFLPFLEVQLFNKDKRYLNYIVLVIQIITGIIQITLLFNFLMNDEINTAMKYVIVAAFAIFIGADIVRIFKYTRKYNESKIKSRYGLSKYINLLIFIMYILFVTYQPDSSMILNDIKIPSDITVAIIENDPQIKFKSESIAENDFQELFADLNKNHIKSIRDLDFLHYLYSIYKDNKHYLLLPHYSAGDELTLKDGYIDNLVISTNNELYISQKKDSFILQLQYSYYKVEASKDTVIKIKNLIDSKYTKNAY